MTRKRSRKRTRGCGCREDPFSMGLEDTGRVMGQTMGLLAGAAGITLLTGFLGSLWRR